MNPAPHVRILVIEDEPQMLRNLMTILRAEGFGVLGAPGGEEGVALARAERPDLILCDLMMPDCDGPSVYQALSQEAPELLERLHFCSGGAFTQRVTDFLTRVGRPVLEKPLNQARLSRLLDERGNT